MIKKLPSGAKLVFPKRLMLHTNLSFQIYSTAKSGSPVLAGSVLLSDIPQLVRELKQRHAEILTQQKELRRQYDRAHPNA